MASAVHVVVQRRAAEDPLAARALEVRHLQHHRKRFRHVDARRHQHQPPHIQPSGQLGRSLPLAVSNNVVAITPSTTTITTRSGSHASR